jgi:hypothetical protein
VSRQRKHDWNEIFSRPRTELVCGQHYQCSQRHIAQMVRTAACVLRIPVMILTHLPDRIIVCPKRLLRRNIETLTMETTNGP